MGKVFEHAELQEELDRLLEHADGIQLFVTEVNKSTDLTVSARPLCYDVKIGKDLVYACNELENARLLFDVIRADLKGDIWNG